ncbi:hypothetical protein HMPREF1141_2427 [Clostridium sp. MSTE9]|nr:hypothetical protein HMPREF1141_2427 [Clostridium sp. MSTE9]
MKRYEQILFADAVLLFQVLKTGKGAMLRPLNSIFKRMIQDMTMLLS